MKNTNKVTKAEKILIKGLIEFYKEKYGDIDLDLKDADNIENDLRGITGNNNMDHRNLITKYIQDIISKENK